MQDPIFTIIQIAILIFSTALHEVAHGVTALYFGDKTAERAGRLTLNPIKHLDLFGSVILPVLLYVVQSPFVFGWAKPVPVNPANLTSKNAEAWVAFAGPFTNFVILIIAGLVMRFFGDVIPQGFQKMLLATVVINASLTLFNLIPLPPFDGFHILSRILRLPSSIYTWSMKYGVFPIVIGVLLFQKFMGPLVYKLVTFVVGA